MGLAHSANTTSAPFDSMFSVRCSLPISDLRDAGPEVNHGWTRMNTDSENELQPSAFSLYFDVPRFSKSRHLSLATCLSSAAEAKEDHPSTLDVLAGTAQTRPMPAGFESVGKLIL
jgi:hypothetical protein